jgi:hypothetical protein
VEEGMVNNPLTEQDIKKWNEERTDDFVLLEKVQGAKRGAIQEIRQIMKSPIAEEIVNKWFQIPDGEPKPPYTKCKTENCLREVDKDGDYCGGCRGL